MFKPVQNRKIYLDIVAQIKDLVEKGVLKPGDKLPSEVELAKQFNASRASVREALAALEIIGLVESKRGCGNSIRKNIDNATIFSTLQELSTHVGPFDLLEARKIIEPGIVTLAVKKATPDKVKKLEAILEEMSDAIKNSTWNEVNTRFHFTIAEIADNPLLLENMRYIVENMKYFVFWRHLESKSLQKPGRLNLFYEDHKELVNCIRTGNEEKAVKIIIRHIEETEKDFLHE